MFLSGYGTSNLEGGSFGAIPFSLSILFSLRIFRDGFSELRLEIDRVIVGQTDQTEHLFPNERLRIDTEGKGIMKAGTVTVNGTQTHFEVCGSGSSVLLISGALGDAGYYTKIAELLSNEFTVATYDRRGNSRGTPPTG